MFEVCGSCGPGMNAERRDIEHRCGLFADQIHDVIIETDVLGVIRYASPSARILTNDPEALIGTDYDDLHQYIHPDDRQMIVDVVARNRETLEPCRYEYRHRVHESEDDYIWLDVSLSFLVSDGDLAGLVTVSRDISERKALEQQVLRAQKLDALGLLAGGIVHDLNNILTPISAYVDLSLADIEPGSPLHRNLSRVDESADRAAELTRKILAFSRQQTIAVEPVPLADVVTDVAHVIEGMVPDDIDLEFNLDDGSTVAAVDREQVQQAIVNLVANSVDATVAGGRIAIAASTVHLDDLSEMEIVGLGAGGYAMLSIADDGLGMTPEVRERMFEPFFTTKPTGTALGLGLAAVYGIVQQHRSTLAVESAPGEGTTVKVYFPLAELGVDAEPPTSEIGATASGNEMLIVVDDEPMIVELLREALAANGYQVLATTSPYECLELLTDPDQRVDLLITDVVMPGLSGLDLHEQASAGRSELPVLYMSGYFESVVRHGVDSDRAFLQKPFTMPELLAKIRTVLG